MATPSLAGLGLALALVAGPVTGQVSSVTGPPRTLSEDIVADLIRDMKVSLQKLVTAQEMFFSDHNRYGKVLSLDNPAAVVIVPAAGVTLSLTYATAGSWTARATHDWLPGMSCVISVGAVPPSRILQTTAQRLQPMEEGVPICDRP